MNDNHSELRADSISLDVEFPRGVFVTRIPRTGRNVHRWLMLVARFDFRMKCLRDIYIQEEARQILGRPLKSKRFRHRKKFLGRLR